MERALRIVNQYRRVAHSRLELVAAYALDTAAAKFTPQFAERWRDFGHWPLEERYRFSDEPATNAWLERSDTYLVRGLMDRYPRASPGLHLKRFCSLFLSSLSAQSPSCAGVMSVVPGEWISLAQGRVWLEPPRGAPDLHWEFSSGVLRLGFRPAATSVALTYDERLTVRRRDPAWRLTRARRVAHLPIHEDAFRLGPRTRVTTAVVRQLRQSYDALTSAQRRLAAEALRSVHLGSETTGRPGLVVVDGPVYRGLLAHALDRDLARRAQALQEVLSARAVTSSRSRPSDTSSPVYDFRDIQRPPEFPDQLIVTTTTERTRCVDWSLLDVLARLDAVLLRRILDKALNIASGHVEGAAYLSAGCAYCLRDFARCRAHLASCLAHSPLTQEYRVLLAFCSRHEGRYIDFDEIIHADTLPATVF
jgi:hypothetical protein